MKIFAGDTLTLVFDLIDGVTGATIDAANVAVAWVRVGAAEYTNADAEVTLDGTTLTLAMPAADTAGLRSTSPVVCKVQLTNGTLSTITSTTLDFVSTNLTTRGV